MLPAHSSRELNRCFTEKLVGKILLKAAYRLFLPSPLRIARVIWQMIPFLKRGLCCLIKGQLKVEVLDAISIGISVLRGDFATAGSVMFLLELGELLEEWTHKKTVEDLAKCMSLNVDRAWYALRREKYLSLLHRSSPAIWLSCVQAVLYQQMAWSLKDMLLSIRPL